MRTSTASPKRLNYNFSRRKFLAGLGAATAFTPFIPILEGQAADGTYPKRLITLFSPNGTLHENWVPRGSETDFTLNTILQPLAPYQDKMIILDGMRVVRQGPGDGHQMGMGCLWTGNQLLQSGEFQGGNGGSAGYAGGISIDQEIADAVGQDTPYNSLEFGVQTGGASVWSRMSYAGSNQPIAPEDNPQAMFDRLFADLGVDTSELDKLKAERRSVIDLVKSDLAALESRYSGDDKLKIEAHLDAMREIERRNDLAAPTCEQPMQTFDVDHESNENFPAVSRQMIDQMVMSLACDLTRVASLQWSRAVSGTRFNWLDISEGHHDISHYGDGDSNMVDWITQINTWYAEEVKYLLDAMSAVPEGDGTMLDNSIIVWGNELSRGNSHRNHPVPFVVLGSGCGTLETGRYLSYGDEAHNRMLVSLARAMDHQIDTFGNNDPGSGGLAGFY